MTRTYAAQKLLEHGPLRYAEMIEITGWTNKTVQSALRRLCNRGAVRRRNARRGYVYELA